MVNPFLYRHMQEKLSVVMHPEKLPVAGSVGGKLSAFKLPHL